MEARTISPRELDRVLARARSAQWDSLAVLGPRVAADESGYLLQLRWPAERIFRLSESAESLATRLAALTDLTSLCLNGSDIGAEGARALSALTNLGILLLDENNIGDEGVRALSPLTQLTWLDLSTNDIGAEGARALAALTNLTVLDLGGNNVADEGARALSALTKLTTLFLPNNNIGAEGARALAALTSLQALSLWKNIVEDDGARALAALHDLTWLHLYDNNVGDEGARALSALTKLTWLDLSTNNVGPEGARTLLEAWAGPPHADQRQHLNLRDNGDLSSVLPPEVLQTNDAQAILAAYRRFRKAAEQETLRVLNEAKLLVVGDEAVGKTSLIRYLVTNEPRDPDEFKTPGSAIHDQIKTETWSPAGGRVTLNVWDFGGQEIMRGTHRFFLTERSLYLLVLWDRLEDDRSIYEWLKTIRNRGGNSPVIVVINKCDDGAAKLRLEETNLRRQDPDIVGFVYTSCDPGERAAASIVRLRALIAETLAANPRLKHVRDPIPTSWLRVKQAVTRGHGSSECSRCASSSGSARSALVSTTTRLRIPTSNGRYCGPCTN